MRGSNEEQRRYVTEKKSLSRLMGLALDVQYVASLQRPVGQEGV
jgi:hypothetical protein